MFRRLMAFVGLVLGYVVIKEFLILHQAARAIHPAGGWVLLALLLLVLGYFVVVPLARIFLLPARLRPARDPEEIAKVARVRLRALRRSPVLRRLGVDAESYPSTPDGFKSLVAELGPESQRIRKKHVTQVFYATSIAQNGFLDAVIILSVATAMVRDYFLLYQGRVGNRELWRIGRLVYLSMAIGGSEGVETATDEILGKLVSSGIKSVPFAARLFGSVADGFVNAALMTRIAMVTESYCTRLFAESDRAFYPTMHAVVSATRTVTADLVDRLTAELRRMAKEQGGNAVKAAVSPVRALFTRAFARGGEEEEPLDWETQWFDEALRQTDRPLKSFFRRLRGRPSPHLPT